MVTAIWFFYFRKRSQRQNQRKSWRESLHSFTSTFSRSRNVRADIHGMGEMEAGNGVGRNTSIRSVMTLPAYSAVPRDNEGVLGREGERAGMDTVVEYPETNEEEETRREEEMSGLYQIRVVRQVEAEARASRRERRREALARGDTTALQAIRQESRRARRERDVSGSTALINEHEGTPRERRVSSVSYANLGVARHDGSRLRANSQDSQLPLLDAAGTMDLSGPIQPWVSRESLARRTDSLTNLSMQSYESEDDATWTEAEMTLRPERTRPGTRPRVDSASSSISQQPSSLTVDTENQEAKPLDHDAAPPPYKSPVDNAATAPSGPRPSSPTADTTESPYLPSIERLPSIRVTLD